MKPPLSAAAAAHNAPVVTLLRLKYWRQRRLLTIEQLARQAQVSENTITRLEHRHPAPRPGTVRKLADALAVRPEDLMGPERRS
jgi:transcriptional regulator with XRE-family HTH domain